MMKISDKFKIDEIVIFRRASGQLIATTVIDPSKTTLTRNYYPGLNGKTIVPVKSKVSSNDWGYIEEKDVIRLSDFWDSCIKD